MSKEDKKILRLLGIIGISVITLFIEFIHSLTMIYQYLANEQSIIYYPIIIMVISFYVTLGSFVYLGELERRDLNG